MSDRPHHTFTLIPSADDGTADALIRTMPEIRRVSMVPNPIERDPMRRLWRKITRRGKAIGSGRENSSQPWRVAATEDSGPKIGWRQIAWGRRIFFAVLVLAQTILASWYLARTFPYPSLSALEIAIVATFAVLFSWISFSFWTAIAGFWVLWKKGKWFSVDDLPTDSDDQPLKSRTAVLMPICNEEVTRVFAGVEASYRSLADTGQLEKFDFFVLSDTSDPDKLVEEELAWAQICQAVNGFGKIYYRRRRNHIKRKSGNIADFLRRWGRNYDTMVVFDADSVMSGKALVCLARMMDRYPRAGIIQTCPTIVNRESLFARMQQFASRVYGPIFSASLHFWQLGESYYWGHNAILRVEPFLNHCGLSRLPGKPPLGAEIFSHDFVEAALMGRAGWEVWIVYDLPGSYEESPPTLLDELKRDRRWCQGNLQHLRLLFGDGVRFGHRAIMLMGIMAYASAFFWAIFLLFSTAEVAVESLIPPVYFSSEPSLFPLWPQWHPEWAIALLSTTAALLFLPKFLSFLLIIRSGASSHFGGSFRLLASIVLEILLSTLFAPVRMWFHSQFVLLTLLGRQIKWGAQRRDDSEISWKEALRQQGISMACGLLWMLGVFWLNPVLGYWLLPVTLSLVLSAPVSVYSSRASLGRALRRWGVFLIPEEIIRTEVLDRLGACLARSATDRRYVNGFVRAVSDPHANALHIAMSRGKSPVSAKARKRNSSLRRKAVTEGPESLSPFDKAYLLRDAESMAALHLDVVKDPDLAKQWRVGSFHSAKDAVCASIIESREEVSEFNEATSDVIYAADNAAHGTQ
ncbi:MAG TPA: glucans biosynthesis glucosyltransferase MdoH [Candidatus Udaeobacter sp.]|nr:glucans biosynthesis glucosyltransferase MdoH [Candidatus Udaeobacter sp.]